MAVGDVSSAERAIRWSAIAAVAAVAGVAAWISYWHAVGVVTVHGEPGITGHLYPAGIDGLIIAASMVLLDAARHAERAPALAWVSLGAGIAATLAVNVLAGLPQGWLSALVATWPALAFVACAELLMTLVRAAARRAPFPEAMTEPGAPETVTDPAAVLAALNGHAAKAEKVFAADITAGRVPGIRRIMTGLRIGDDRARLVQEHLRSLTPSTTTKEN